MQNFGIASGYNVITVGAKRSGGVWKRCSDK